MAHSLRAKLWIGEEKEGSESGKKLFVDGASYFDIENALDEHPEITEVYFAHGFDKEVVRALENKIEITLEVKSLDDVPEDLKGRVNLILRLPNYVDACKKLEGTDVYVADLDDGDVNSWNGKKAYEEDEVLIYDE